MYLKQLELENFKSFGKKLTIPFLEGFTSVTGPNGSGKSNISDAILFVLGPKSSKALRAAKLTDLIFNGGESKKASDYCKVSLFFDNADRTIPIDSEVVKLTRHVKLSETTDGYNSYFYVNDRKSSLTEFDSLLANSRISAEGYNLVQQGDVTRIVGMSTVDRRKILDDISGISKYDEEIIKALDERKKAEENIDRIAIILAEIEKQIKQLEEERTAALKFIDARDKLQMAKLQIAHKRRESTGTEIESIRKQSADYLQEIEGLKLKKIELLRKIEEAGVRVASLEKDLETRGGSEAKDLKEKMDAVKIDLARTQEQGKRAQADVEELESLLKEKLAERDSVSRELSQLEAKVTASEQGYLEQLRALDQKKAELEQVQGKVASSDEELGTLDKNVAALDEKVQKLEDEKRELLLEKDRQEEKRDRLKVELANLEEGKKTLEFEMSDSEFNIRNLRSSDKSSSGEMKSMQDELFQKKNLEVKLTRQADELEQVIRSLTRDYNQLKAEQEAAENVAKGYNRAVRSLLEARDRREIKGIHGTIAELAEVEKQYEVALNVAAGNRMQSIVVDDDEVAASAIQLLKRNNLGRATFLPLNKMLDGKPRGKAILAEKEAAGFAIDLIRFNEKYRAAFWYVFGDTVVVDSLDKARRLMGGVRLVTVSGELIESSGAMVGGTVEQSNLKFGSGKGRLDEVAEELRKSTEHAEKVNEELRKVRADLLQVEAAIRAASSTGGANNVKLDALESRKKELKGRLLQADEEIRKYSAELSEAERGVAEAADELHVTEESLQKMKGERDAGRKRITDIAPKELSLRLRTLQGQIADLTGKVAELKSAKDTAETQIGLVKQRHQEFLDLDGEGKGKLVKLRKDAKAAAEKETKLTIELNGLKKIEESMGNELKGLRDRRDAAFREKTKLEGDRDKVQGRIETSDDINIGMQTKQKAAEDRLRELENEIATYKMQVMLPLPNLEELKDVISRCEALLGNMGNVNLRAIEDYDEKKKRHTELREETKRLDEQRRDLIKLMDELNEKKKIALGKVFIGINENFQRTYAELSGGGEAELVLENPESPFEAGLMMKVKPRLGKVLRLDALSGGEKSLAALAFIFAIQQYQPSPFYLLDEVDMFLDAVNADMVAQRVQRASKTAQFVMISLRKVTLSKADHVVGVTKGEGGISRVIMKPNIGDIKDLQEELQIPEEKAEGAA